MGSCLAIVTSLFPSEMARAKLLPMMGDFINLGRVVESPLARLSGSQSSALPPWLAKYGMSKSHKRPRDPNQLAKFMRRLRG